MNRGIERALLQLGVEYDIYFYQFKDWEVDGNFLEQFREKIKYGTYNKVFSINFSPLISLICEEMSIPYIAWVYDSPVHIRNLEPMKNSCNTIYFFDRGQAEEYKKMGISAKYMPLAADVRLFEEIIQKNKLREKYKVSLLGNLYQTDYAYFASPLNPYLTGYLEGMISSQLKIYGGYLIPELVTDELLGEMNEIYKTVSTDGFQINRRELEFMLAQEVTGRERYTILALLSAHFPVDLYSAKNDERLANVRFHGYADYETKMPAVFDASQINLNISLKCIRTGIPLRVIEILGCGGFALSNYQEELMEYFLIGEECEIYENLEDLYAKTAFYLQHEDICRQIAENGKKRVERDFTFEERLQKMLL